MNVNINPEIKSSLIMQSLYVDSFSFHRKPEITDVEVQLNFQKDVVHVDDSTIKVELACFLQNSDSSFDLDVKIVGTFEVSSDDIPDISRNSLIHTNAIAIMFPFLRSQISILSTQPEFSPLMIPIMNIAKMFNNENEGIKSDN